MAARGRDLRALARVSVAAALGGEGELRRNLQAALRAGATPGRLDEALLQLVVCVGYARVINAFAVLRQLVPEPSRSRRIRGRLRRRGESLCRRIYGSVYDRMIAGMARLHPDLAEWILSDGYGKVLARPALSIRERELLLVAVLAAQGMTRQLESHRRGARRVGARAAQVAAMRALGTTGCGLPCGTEPNPPRSNNSIPRRR